MEAHEDPRKKIAFLLKHRLRPRVYPRSPIAGCHDEAAKAHADQIVNELEQSGYRITKKPPAPLHSADCGKR